MTLNKLITKGFGSSLLIAGRAGLVTQGYGGEVPEFIPVAIERAIRRTKDGGSSSRPHPFDELEEVIVFARLLQINDEEPARVTKGVVTMPVYRSPMKIFAERINTVIEEGIIRIKVYLRI